jgi:Na+-driven multidrug efflux pump
MGLATAMDTLASQAYGSGQIEKVRAVARHRRLMLLIKLSIQRFKVAFCCFVFKAVRMHEYR